MIQNELYMLTWLDILKFANQNNPVPDQKVEKTDAEWKEILTDEQYFVTRKKGTERPFSSEMCESIEPGLYACVCCGTLLFDSREKFQSGTGWPSFTQPIKDNVISYHKDNSHEMVRVETLCSTCDAHLGHVFQDGPKPGGLRYCINALALKKVESNFQKLTLGGGCFWCTEAIFQQIQGVDQVVSGYSGGKVKNPTYKEVTSGLSGHAEVVEISYNPAEISFDDLVRIHLTMHDPTTLNRQGGDVGSQYRSIIFYRNEEEKKAIQQIIKQVQASYKENIVTEIAPFEYFYNAEDYHQDYFNNNAQKNPYCSIVIEPKLQKFRTSFQQKLKVK